MPSSQEVNLHQLSYPDEKGILLSAMLAKIQAKIESLPGDWVRCEISSLKINKNHFFIELVEHDENHQIVAKCAAHLWSSKRQAISNKFLGATGSELKAGIKVLIRAIPRYHITHGFSLDIQDIDPAYTLGDMQRKIQEIRNRLVNEGIVNLNKSLTCPNNFYRVAVIAPEEAAGLGDFNATVKPLHEIQLCRFRFFKTTFQGTSASSSICKALAEIRQVHDERPICAVVIIRGGGAVTDLAYLNDYAIAKSICNLGIPVLTGIGHEKDSTILDEVCCRKFDTPSKVAAYIYDSIVSRCKEAENSWIAIKNIWSRISQQSMHEIKMTMTSIQHNADIAITKSKHASDIQWKLVDDEINDTLKNCQQKINRNMQSVNDNSTRHLSAMSREVKMAMQDIGRDSLNAIAPFQSAIDADIELTKTKAQSIANQLKTNICTDMLFIKDGVFRTVIEANQAAQSTVSMIHGQAQLAVSIYKTEISRLTDNIASSTTIINDKYRHKLDQSIHATSTTLFQKIEEAKDALHEHIHDIDKIARRSVTLTKKDIDRTFQEVVGLGPQKTLKRGFSIARSNGKVVTSVKEAKYLDTLDLEFIDGHITLLNTRKERK